jgi:hypothetical protein
MLLKVKHGFCCCLIIALFGLIAVEPAKAIHKKRWKKQGSYQMVQVDKTTLAKTEQVATKHLDIKLPKKDTDFNNNQQHVAQAYISPRHLIAADSFAAITSIINGNNKNEIHKKTKPSQYNKKVFFYKLKQNRLLKTIDSVKTNLVTKSKPIIYNSKEHTEKDKLKDRKMGRLNFIAAILLWLVIPLYFIISAIPLAYLVTILTTVIMFIHLAAIITFLATFFNIPKFDELGKIGRVIGLINIILSFLFILVLIFTFMLLFLVAFLSGS